MSRGFRPFTIICALFHIGRIVDLFSSSWILFLLTIPFKLLYSSRAQLWTPWAMASSTTTTSIPLQEPVFRQSLHDVHHAYLLLHRAMALLPPTMIPNMEPTPLPSTGIWDQPEGLQPEFFAAANVFIDRAQFLFRSSTTSSPTWKTWWISSSHNFITTLFRRHLPNVVAEPTRFLLAHRALPVFGQWKTNKSFIP